MGVGDLARRVLPTSWGSFLTCPGPAPPVARDEGDKPAAAAAREGGDIPERLLLGGWFDFFATLEDDKGARRVLPTCPGPSSPRE